MQALDYEVIQHLVTWLDEGSQPWLCTIVRTVGSSPRPVGSMLALCDDGRQIGSVSGGCIEEDLLERLRDGVYSGEKPQIVEYGVSAEENERLGLPCGGRIILQLERLRAADKEWLTTILSSLDKRRCIERHLDLDSGTTTLQPAEHFTPLVLDDQRLQQCFGPRMRILLVGAGQLAWWQGLLVMARDFAVGAMAGYSALRGEWPASKGAAE